MKWYSSALEAAPSDLNELDESAVDESDYKIQAKVAAMYSQGEWVNNTKCQLLVHRHCSLSPLSFIWPSTGGHGIERDWQQAGDWFQQAGDGAMAAMKGKLATNYYMQAEEAWGNLEDNDDELNHEQSLS